MPEIYLVIFFLLVLFTDIIFGRNSAKLCRAVACMGIAIVIFKDYQLGHIMTESKPLFSNMLFITKHRWFLSL